MAEGRRTTPPSWAALSARAAASGCDQRASSRGRHMVGASQPSRARSGASAPSSVRSAVCTANRGRRQAGGARARCSPGRADPASAPVPGGETVPASPAAAMESALGAGSASWLSIAAPAFFCADGSTVAAGSAGAVGASTVWATRCCSSTQEASGRRAPTALAKTASRTSRARRRRITDPLSLLKGRGRGKSASGPNGAGGGNPRSVPVLRGKEVF